MQNLVGGMERLLVKGTGVRARSNPDHEPNFWIMRPWMPTAALDSSPTATGGGMNSELIVQGNCPDQSLEKEADCPISRRRRNVLDQQESQAEQQSMILPESPGAVLLLPVSANKTRPAAIATTTNTWTTKTTAWDNDDDEIGRAHV